MGPNGEIPIEHISLQFDNQEKIYSMLVWLDMKKLSEKEADFHFSSSGVEIYFDPDWYGSHIKITNLPKQKDVKNFRRNTKFDCNKKCS